jgi:hypothetical protein
MYRGIRKCAFRVKFSFSALPRHGRYCNLPQSIAEAESAKCCDTLKNVAKSPKQHQQSLLIIQIALDSKWSKGLAMLQYVPTRCRIPKE